MNNSSDKVSVVITSYNQKHYLREAIESVIDQTVKPYEIIIADDHSTDGSVELIQGYMARYPNWIKGVFQEQNVGIPRNRNAALRQVNGNYVAILDGDDRLLPHNLELQLNALNKQPEVGCVYTNLYFINAEGTRTGIRDDTLQPAGDIFAYLAGGKMGLMRSMLIRYDVLLKACPEARGIGFLDKRFSHHDGFIFTVRLAKQTKYAYVLDPLAEYRVHDKGVSKNRSSAYILHQLEQVYAEMLTLIEELPPQEIVRIKMNWFFRLRQVKVLAEVEAGKKLTALSSVASAWMRHPRQIRRRLYLIRPLLRGSK